MFAVGEVVVWNFGSGSGVLSIATKDLPADLRQRCESPFEGDVFDMLVTRGYRAIPQVPVGAYRIDMVVEGDNVTAWPSNAMATSTTVLGSGIAICGGNEFQNVPGGGSGAVSPRRLCCSAMR